jgi:hypothetical protein
MPLPEFLAMLKMRLLERTIYTRNVESFSISPNELPPIIPPSLCKQEVNTEMDKKSVYLKPPSESSGKLAHSIIPQNEVMSLLGMWYLIKYLMSSIIQVIKLFFISLSWMVKWTWTISGNFQSKILLKFVVRLKLIQLESQRCVWHNFLIK